MISPKCLEPSWIDEHSKKLKVADPGILETAIHALELLCRLQRSGLEFLFKGGTSLLLHLPTIRRLSIDIDIVCQTPKAEFERVLHEIVNRPPFLGCREDERGTDRLPKRRHYFVEYPSRRGQGNRRSVIIDVLEEPCGIVDLEDKPVSLPFLELADETRVRVPTINALLGDKLTAFAPNTVGVPLNERYSQQVVKQMFDVGELFLVADDLEAVSRNYHTLHDIEASYRERKHHAEESLRDTIETCFHYCQVGLKGDPNQFPDQRALLLRGVGQLRGHLINHPFNRDVAKLPAARAAHLATRILTQQIEPFEAIRYHDGHLPDLRNTALSEARRVLQRLKALPEALFHWKTVCELEQAARA